MKSPFDLFRRLIILGVAARLAATPTIEISTGSTASPVRLSLSVENRVAARVPQAPDLATAYWVVAPLPVVVPAGHGYYGAVRSINAHGDALGNDLSLIKHVAADGAVTSLGSYNFHFNGGRQLDDAGRVVLNSRLGTDGFLFKVSSGSASEGVRYAGTRLTSLDNAGGLLGVTLSETNQSDRDYWGLHFVEREDRRRELELPADSNFGADLMALNERDEVVGGAFQIPSNWWRGLYLKPGRAPRWLPGFGEYEDVYNLNVHGQLVGSTAVPAGFGYAAGVYPALWDSGAVGRVKVLDTDRSLFGGEYGWAWAANRWGHIVGRTRSGGALWLNGSPYDFSGRIINPDNIRLDYFADINDKGEIVGAEYGSRNLPASRAFIMRPVWPSLAVDLNRDGKIALPIDGDKSDVTSPAMPFRFWINDDDDELVDSSIPGVYSELEQDDKEITNADKEDWRDNVIDVPRDLEDFARINLYLGGLQDVFNNGKLFLGLKWTDTNDTNPAIKLYRETDSNASLGYLFNTSSANRQSLEAAIIDGRFPDYSGDNFQSDHTLISGNGFFVIPTIQLDALSANRPTVRFIFEGCFLGKGQLKFVILLKENGNYTEVCEGPGVWIETKKPKDFVERWSAGDGDLQEVHPVVRQTSNSAFPAWGMPANEDEKDYVLYVHGYNMQEFEKQRWIETTFKRLYWLGYKGRVGGFTWPCSQSAPPFDASEERAWQSGTQLIALMNGLKTAGYRVHVIGHSQGNVVVAEALRQWNTGGNTAPLVRTYIASQAAIQAHCYDPQAPLIPDFAGSFTDDGTPNVYVNYPSTGEPYMSITQVGNAASSWLNFENPGDYALTGNSLNPLDLHLGWQIKQRLKPDQGFTYNVVDGFLESTATGTRALNLPDDRFRIFSYAAEGRSLALGSTPTGGVFADNNTDLSTTLSYGLHHRFHSGQFRASNAERYEYWRRVLIGIGLQPFTP